MRLNQFIASRSSLSRRAADIAITDGRVTVDGKAASVGQAVSDTSEVILDGRVLTAVTATYVVINKPVGYVTSRRGQGSKTIYDLLPPQLAHLKPVGRLDKDSSGLLVLTNDGPLAQRLTHPSSQKLKSYTIALDRPLSASAAGQLRGGVQLADGSSQLRLAGSGRRWQVEMHEGRNRQIRRSFAALGYTVEQLERTQFGKLRLKLKSGQWQEIKPEDIE